MDDILLKQYVETANNPEYKGDWNVIDSKFPEFKGVDKTVLKQYVETANNPAYKSDFEVINSKFPELFQGNGALKPTVKQQSYAFTPEIQQGINVGNGGSIIQDDNKITPLPKEEAAKVIYGSLPGEVKFKTGAEQLNTLGVDMAMKNRFGDYQDSGSPSISVPENSIEKDIKPKNIPTGTYDPEQLAQERANNEQEQRELNAPAFSNDNLKHLYKVFNSYVSGMAGSLGKAVLHDASAILANDPHTVHDKEYDKLQGNLSKAQTDLQKWQTKDAPKLKGTFGEGLVSAAPMIGLIGADLLSGGSLTPAVTATFAEMGRGEAFQALDDWDNATDEKGQKLHAPTTETQRQAAAVGYMLAYTLPIGKYLDKYLVKGAGKYVMSKVLTSNPEMMIKAGTEIIESAAKQNPSLAAKIIKTSMSSALHGVGTMEAIDLVKMATDKVVIGKGVSRDEFLNRIGEQAKSGFIFGMALAPTAAYANIKGNIDRRNSQGEVTFTIDDKGKSVEILPSKEGKVKGMRPDGSIIDVTQSMLDNSFTMTTDHFNEVVKGYKQSGEMPEDNFERDAFSNRLSQSLKKVATSHGNITVAKDAEGNNIYVQSRNENGELIGIDSLGKQVIIPEGTETVTQNIGNVHESIMRKYDEARSTTEQAPEQSPEQLKLEQRNQQINDATQNAQTLINNISNNGQVIEAKLKGVDQPVNIVKGDVFLNEDGSVDMTKSSKTFIYKTNDGKSHPGNLDFIEDGSVTITPNEEAINQTIEPIINQIANEEAPEHEIGSKVVIKDQKTGFNSIVTITGRDQEGNYTFKSTDPDGNPVQGGFEPREVNQVFNGVFDGNGVVEYINPDTGETMTGVLELDTPEAQQQFTEGNYAKIDGQDIPFENIKGQYINEALQEQPEGQPEGLLPEGATEAQNEGVEAEAQAETPVAPKTFKEQIPVQAVLDGKGKPTGKTSTIYEQAPIETTIGALNEQFDSEEVQQVVTAKIKKIESDIEKAGKLKITGDIDTDAANKAASKQALQGLNEQLSYWNGVNEAIKPKEEVHPEIPMSDSNKDYYVTTAKSGTDVNDIKNAYDMAMSESEIETLLPWQTELLSMKIHPDSFNELGDRNYAADVRAWLLPKKTQRTPSNSIDTIAEELSSYGIEVTPDMIVEFMTDHPNMRAEKGNEYTRDLSRRFSEVATKMAGMPIGGFESKSGKVFLAAINSIQNKNVIFVEPTAQELAFVEDIPLEDDSFEALFNAVNEIDVNELTNFIQSEYEKNTITAEVVSVDAQGQSEPATEPTKEVSKEEQFNLIPAETFEQFETNVNWFLENYGSREMAAIQVEIYLNEKPEFGKEYADKYGITTREQLAEFLGKLQTKLRTGKGKERQAVLKEIEDEKAQRNIDNIVDIALKASAEMDALIASQDINTTPTEAQKEAGNYKKAHVVIQDMDITIENPKGSVRSGVDEDGTAWEHEMNSHYGYFKGTVGRDGDHVDTFIGNNPESKQVFVIDQTNPTNGKFDESKVMIGYDSAEQAKAAYLENYDKDWKGFYAITEVGVDDFKTWLYDGKKQHKPFAEYKDTPEATEKADQLPERPTRFEAGKKLTKTEKQDVLKSMIDSYKAMNRPSTFEADSNGFERFMWLDNASDYMQISDITGRKLRWFITLPDGRIAHPTELYPELATSEIKAFEDSIEKWEKEAKNSYKNGLKKIAGKEQQVFEVLKRTLDAGAEFSKQYDSNDVAERNPLITLRFPNITNEFNPNGIRRSVQAQLKNVDESLDFGEFDFDWERFYNENLDQLPDTGKTIDQSEQDINKIGEKYGIYDGKPNKYIFKPSSYYIADKTGLKITVGNIASIKESLERMREMNLVLKNEMLSNTIDYIDTVVELYDESVRLKDVGEAERAAKQQELTDKIKNASSISEVFDFGSDAINGAFDNLSQGLKEFGFRLETTGKLKDAINRVADYIQKEYDNVKDIKELQGTTPVKEQISLQEGTQPLKNGSTVTYQGKQYTVNGITADGQTVDLEGNGETIEDISINDLDNSKNNSNFVENNNNESDQPLSSVPQQVPQGNNGTENERDGRTEEIATELKRRSEQALRDAQKDSQELSERERIDILNSTTENYAKENGLWIKYIDSTKLGEPGLSGTENEVYVDSENNTVYKVNNLIYSKMDLLKYFEYIENHNKLFPETAYKLIGFTGFDNGTIYPVVKQNYVANATESTPEITDNFMQSLGFTKVKNSTYTNGDITVSDLLPRNVLVKSNGSVYVIDDNITRNAEPDTKTLDELTGGEYGKAKTEQEVEILDTDSKIQNIQSKPKITAQAEKIEDVGVKIGGAKKDLFKEYADKIANVSDEDIARLPLSKSFPRPNFSQLIEDGKMTQETAIFLNYFYDEIPSKPQKTYKLKQWVDKVRGALDTFNSVMDKTPDRDLMQEFIDKMNTNRWTQDHAFRAEAYRAIKKAVNFPNNEVNTGNLSLYNGKTETGTNYYAVRTPVGDRARLTGRFSTMDEAIAKLIEMSKESAGKPKQIEFNVYSSRKTGEFFITPKGKSDIVLQGGFKTADEAFKYRTENAQALNDRFNAIKELPDERRISNNPRIGFDYRQGKDVSPEEFGKEFGFRGVEFGNWVNQEERQAHINEAYDALMDLSTVIGVSPKALSLNGELGFAFGSRGGGKYAAHYETDKVVINLTKTKGAGCLAHEWFHALDNYLLRSVGNKSSYATDGPGFNKEGKPALRSELNDSFRNLMKVIRSTGFYTRSTKIDRTKGSKYWGTAVELGARGFEDFVMNKLAQSNIKNDYLVNFKSLAEFIDRAKGDISDVSEKYPYPTLEESPKINEAFQNLFDTIEEGENGVLFEPQAAYDNKNTLKQKQLDILLKTNPMLDDYHTGIRKLSDIKTLEEAINEPEWDYDEYNPDYIKQMAQKAIETGKVLVYSSNPIKNGTFVSPSKMEAESYSGNGKVYSKEVNTNDVAWIDPTQGQYAEMSNELLQEPKPTYKGNLGQYAKEVNEWNKKQLPATIEIDGVERPTTNSNGKPIHSTEEGIRNFYEWFGDSKVVDAESRPLVVYHATMTDFNEFSKSKIGKAIDFGTMGKGFYFTSVAENANNIARNLKTNKIKNGNESIMPIYLSIQNPYDAQVLIETSGDNEKESAKFTKKLIEKGFDGAKFEFGYSTNQVWFNALFPAQIKSATGNNGAFDVNDANILNEPQTTYVSDNGFYSTVEKSLNAIQQEKGTKDQFKAMLLKNGAKQAEMDWMGFDELPEKLNKADIQNWIDENRIEVQEVHKKLNENIELIDSEGKSLGIFPNKEEAKKSVTLKGGWLNTVVGERLVDGNGKTLINLVKGVPETNTKYSQYVLPGGENYKELLLTMPVKGSSITVAEKEELETLQRRMNNEVDFPQKDYDRYKTLMQKGRDSFDNKSQFKSSHYDEPNILAHIRFDERTVNGEKVLFIEEFQSDWAQKGKKEGFKGDYKNKSLVEPRFDGKYWYLHEKESGEMTSSQSFSTEAEAWKQVEGTMQLMDNGVPDMPFKKTDQWVNLAARRMMRYAAENGFDRIAWTNGEQQADRYSLAEQVDKITVRKDNISDAINKNGERVQGYVVNAVKGNNRVINNETMSIEKIEETLGKEISKGVVDGKELFEGEGLKVGGQGMKAFYDAIVPSAMSKLGKPFGAKLEPISLNLKTNDIVDSVFERPNGTWGIAYEQGKFYDTKEQALAALESIRPSGTTQQSIPVTESMKKTASEGLPLFEPTQTFITFTPEEITDETNKAHGSTELQRIAREKTIEAANSLVIKSDNLRGLHPLRNGRDTESSAGDLPNNITPTLSKRTVLEGFKESGYINFNGTKVTSHQDIADLWSIHRSPYIEKGHVVFIKDGVIVGTIATTANKADITKLAEVDEVVDYANKLGATGVYLLHNHPSGNPTPSSQDIRMTLGYSEMLDAFGIEMLGHVVVDHDKYSVIDTRNDGGIDWRNTGINHSIYQHYIDNSVQQFDYSKHQPKLFTEREVVGKGHEAPEKMFEIGKTLLSDPSYKAAVVFLQSSPKDGYVVSAHEILPDASLEDIKRIAKEGLDVNLGARAIIIHDGSYGRTFGEIDERIIDIIDTKKKGVYHNSMSTAAEPMNFDTLWAKQIIGEYGATSLDKAEEATTRLDNLKVAKEMEVTKTPKEIRLATGWEKGVDGLWRYEVPDGKLSGTLSSEPVSLSKVWSDEELFTAYPQLKDIKINAEPYNGINSAIYYSEEKQITIYRNRFGTLPESANSSVIHEVQHAIQEIEGFSVGSNVGNEIGKLNAKANNITFEEYKDAISSFETELENKKQELDQINNSKKWNKSWKAAGVEVEINKLKAELKKLVNTNASEQEAFDNYRKMVGEVEARNVQYRLKLTPEDRRNTLLSETADVAPEDQRVITDGLGVSMSLNEPKPIYGEPGHETETISEWATRVNEYNGKSQTYVTENLSASKRRSDLKEIERLLTKTKDKSAELKKVKNYIEKNLQADMEKLDVKPEYEKLITKLEKGITTRDVNKLIRLIDNIISNSEEGKFSKMLEKVMDTKTVKINDKLVSEAKMVGATIREDLEYINTYKGMDETAIEKRINEIYAKYIEDNQGNDADSEMTEEQLHELQNLEILKKIAVRNVAMENVKEVKQDIKEIKDEIKKAREAGDKTVLKNLKTQLEALEEEQLDAQKEFIKATKESITSIQQLINTGKIELKEWISGQKDRKSYLNKMGNSAVANDKSWSQEAIKEQKEKHLKEFFKNAGRAIVDFMYSPFGTFNTMLKFIDTNHIMGEGRLYKYFMVGEEGVLQADYNYQNGLRSAREELDEASKRITGKSITDLVKSSRKHDDTPFTLTYSDKKGLEHKIKMSYGELLYLYAANKMKDGRTKLLKMGLGEPEMETITNAIPKELRDFQDWVQSEFLPKRREKYNTTHKQMFGTSMAKIEGYFPFKYDKKEIKGKQKDIAEEDIERLPSSITGSIMNRQRNKNTLTLMGNAFDVLYDNMIDMEEWNAFAQVRRDVNTLINNQFFMNSIDTQNEGASRMFKEAAKIAVHSFIDNTMHVESALAKANRVYAGGAIAFRGMTALKQILSYPAFLGHSINPAFHLLLVRNLSPDVTVSNWKWAMENLPGFKDRWQSKNIGDEKILMQQSVLDKGKNTIITTGMFPNRLVDALSTIAGSKSVYDYEYKRLRKEYDHEKANHDALMLASIAYNETQQSSLDSFLSPIQKSGSAGNRFLTTFMNNNFAYSRKVGESIIENYRITFGNEKLKENLIKDFVKQGHSEEYAKEKARKKLAETFVHNLGRTALFGFALGMLWRYGLQTLIGAFGDDDDENKKDVITSLPISFLDGTIIVGQAAEALASGYSYNPILIQQELGYQMKNIMKAVNEDGLISFTTLSATANLASRFGGINVDTYENMYNAVDGVMKDKSVSVDNFLLFLNTPKSLLKNRVLKYKEGESFVEYSKRVKTMHNENQYKKIAKQVIERYYFSDEGNMTRFNRVKKLSDEYMDLLNKDLKNTATEEEIATLSKLTPKYVDESGGNAMIDFYQKIKFISDGVSDPEFDASTLLRNDERIKEYISTINSIKEKYGK